MKLKTKLIAATSIPLLVVAGLGASIVAARFSERARAFEARDRLALMADLGAVIQAVQAERGQSTLFIAGGKDGAAMREARETSDRVFAERGAGLERAGSIDRDAPTEIAGAKEALATLRSSVDSGSLAAAEAFEEYLYPVDSLLAVLRRAAKSAPVAYSRAFTTLLVLEEAKESAGRTRARVSSAAALDAALSDEELALILGDFNAARLGLFGSATDLEGGLDIARSYIPADLSWTELSDAVLGLVRKGSRGGYGLDAELLYTHGTKVVDSVKAIIEGKNAETVVLIEAEIKADTGSIVIVSGATLAVVAAVLALVLALVTSIIRRLSTLNAAFGEIAKGEGDLTKCLDADSADEIGGLSCDFNAFTESLRGTVERAKGATVALRGDLEELATNMNETAGAVEEIAATIESIKQQALSQGAGVTEASATVEEIAKRVVTLVRSIERQGEALAGSSSSIEEMVANVQSVAANVDRMGEAYKRLQAKGAAGREAIAKASSRAQDIDRRSETLADANALIAGIAAQTNLLAMNAAIEAAHAGEAGRGFAVVADEIRKLAENAARQSKTVARDIASIRQEIGEVVGSSAEAERGFGDMVGQIEALSRLEEEVDFALREQSQGSAQVLEALATINAIARETRSESELMKTGSAEVLEEMRRLLGLTAELENGMSEMAAGAAEIRSASYATNELSIRASDSVRVLAAEMEKFRT